MEQPIIVRYHWTADEYIISYDCHKRRSMRPAFRTAYNILFILSCLASIFLFVHRDWIVASVSGLCFIWWVFSIFGTKMILRNQFAKRPDQDSDIEYQFSPEGITITTSHAHSEMKWETLTEVVRTPKGYLLYPFPQLYYWLPKEGFENEEAYERFFELAKSKINKSSAVV